MEQDVPRLSLPVLQSLSDVAFNRKFVVSNILLQVLCTHEHSNLEQLVIVVRSLKHRVLLEHHVTHGTSERPHVEGIIVMEVINKELWTLVVSTSHSHVVRLLGNVILGETPIDDPNVSLLVVDHDIMRLDVSMHDTHGVTEVKSLQNLVHVVPNIEVSELLE